MRGLFCAYKISEGEIHSGVKISDASFTPQYSDLREILFVYHTCAVAFVSQSLLVPQWLMIIS